jgi:hypothetical protein
VADTKVSALPAVTTAAGTDEIPVNQAGTSKKLTLAQVKAFASPDTFTTLSSTQANSTTTAASATALEQVLAAGTYLIKAWVVYQAAATTTGIEFRLNHTGTVTRCAATWYTLTTGTTATSGIADQATTLTAQMMEGKGQRANNTATGPTQGVDTANADQFAVLEGIVVVTASGTLQLMFNSEVAASAVTLQVGTTMTVTKVA